MLYHGTQIQPKIVFKEGLKPISLFFIFFYFIKFLDLNDIKFQFNAVIRKLKHRFVYCDSDFNIAKSYALSGSNFLGCLNLKLINNKNGYIYVINKEGKGEKKFYYISPNEIVNYFKITK